MMSQGHCSKFVVEGLAIRKRTVQHVVEENNLSSQFNIQVKRCIRMFDLIIILAIRNYAAQEWPTL